MESIFSPFFNIVDVQSNAIRYWGDAPEIMEGTTYDDAAKYTAKVVLGSDAKGVLKCKSLTFRCLSNNNKISKQSSSRRPCYHPGNCPVLPGCLWCSSETGAMRISRQPLQDDA
jgi:hypothetical protein